MAKRHEIEHERWWVTYEHPEMGQTHVQFRWEHRGHGIYEVVPTAVEFDMFTPEAVQEELRELLSNMRVRSVRDERA